MKIYGLEVAEEYWVVGRRSAGLKGFEPLWEQAWPARLTMAEQIREKSLDELEDLMSGFSQDATREDSQDDAATAGSNGRDPNLVDNGQDGGGSHGHSSAARTRDDREPTSTLTQTTSTVVTTSSGSDFVPSV